MGMSKDQKPKTTPVHQIMPDEVTQAILEVDHERIVGAKLEELANILWRPEG